MTICPCCGFKFEGDLRSGCIGCGARAVGEPLARPEHELPAFGRAVVIGAIGASALLLFLVVTIVVFVTRAPFSFDLSSIIVSAETAAWRLKWIGFPLALGSIWLSWRILSGMRKTPLRFMGMRVARGGIAASALFALLMTTLVGITVPERLRQRERGIEASHLSRLYTHNRAFMEYRASFGTYPTDLNDLRNLPDADGSIAELISQSDSTSYKPWTELAATQPAPAKSQNLRGVAIRPASLNSGGDDSPTEGVPFTNYELRLAGQDKILGTDDDWLMQDGMVRPANDLPASTTVVTSGPQGP